MSVLAIFFLKFCQRLLFQLISIGPFDKIAFSKFLMLGGNIVAVGASQVDGEELPRKEEAICDILTLLRKFCN